MTTTRWSPTDSGYQARLLRAHEDLRADAGLRDDRGLVRAPVLASWRRSLAAAPERGGTGDAALDGEELTAARQAHLFSAVLPLLRSRLIDPAVEAGLMVALGDADGRLLWVEGRPQLISRADAMGFAAGADWSESAMGTSAPALALTTASSMQVVGAEHFHEAVHPWSCSAVPVRHPHTRETLGVLDVTGSTEAVSPLVLPLLEATARAVQEELSAHLPAGPAAEEPVAARRPRILPRSPAAPAELLLTGRRIPLLRQGSRRLELSGRRRRAAHPAAPAPRGHQRRRAGRAAAREHRRRGHGARRGGASAQGALGRRRPRDRLTPVPPARHRGQRSAAHPGRARAR